MASIISPFLIQLQKETGRLIPVRNPHKIV